MPTLAGNVIRGTVSYNAAAGTSPTAITLPRTINAAKSVVFYTQRGGGSTIYRDHREFFGYELTNTTLQFLRTTATSAATINLSYEVVEFADATSVQHIVQEITSTQTDITISAVDMDRSAVFVLGSRTDQDVTRAYAVRLESSTNVRVNCNTAPGAGDLILYIAVVQFDTDVSVQRGAVSLGSGNTTASGTVNIEAVDPTRSVVIGNGQNEAAANYYRMAVSWTFVDGETIEWNRAAYGSQVSKVLPWQVITLANGFSRHGSYEITDGNTTPASQPSFAALDPTKSSLVVGFPLNECRPTVDISDTGMGGAGNYRTTIVPSVDFDGLTITRGSARSGTAMAGTFAALQWEGGDPTEEMPPTDVNLSDLLTGPTHVSANLVAEPGGSEVGTNLQYFISESATPPGDESEDWIDVEWDELPYPVTFKGSRNLWLHTRTVGSLDPSNVVTYPFTSPNLRIVGPVSNQPVPLEGFDTGIVDSTGHEPGAAGRIDWRADGNTVGEDVSIVVNAPSVSAPANITPPVITGSGYVGDIHSMSNGTWSNSPTDIIKQWTRDGFDIEGATGNSYTLVEDDIDAIISGYAIASNIAGNSAPAYANDIGPVQEAPEPGDFPLTKIDDITMTPTLLGVQVSETGRWPVYYLGEVSDGVAYGRLLESDAEFCEVHIIRDPGYFSTKGTRNTVNLQYWDVECGEDTFQICAFNGARGIWRSKQPIAPTMERLLTAIENKRCLPYMVEALSGWQSALSWNKRSLPSSMPDNYRPDRPYGLNASLCIFNNVSGAASENPSSRGFIDSDSAQMLAAAFADNLTAFNVLAERCYHQTLYSTTMPNFYVWSKTHHQLRDPQIPLAGESVFSLGGGRWPIPDNQPYKDELYGTSTEYASVEIVSITKANPCVITYTGNLPHAPSSDREIHVINGGGMTELDNSSYSGRINNTAKTITLNQCNSTNFASHVSGGSVMLNQSHGRDTAHLFNHAFIYWLATGDPIAGEVQYALTQSALSSTGPRRSGVYTPQANYQRWHLNFMNAVWKARDVANHLSGPALWETTRVQKMFDDILNERDIIQQAVDTQNMSLLPAGYAASSAVLKEASAAYQFDIGNSISDFMAQNYGAESAYLLASVGRPELLDRLARMMVWRMYNVGGTRGADNIPSSTLVTFSGNYDTIEEIIEAYFDPRTDHSTTTFNQAQLMYTLRIYWLLKMAQDAVAREWMDPIPNLDDAVSAMLSCRAGTTNWRYLELTMYKHMGVTFTDAGIDVPEEE